MFVTFEDLYDSRKAVKVIRSEVVGLSVQSYTPIVNSPMSRMFRGAVRGPTLVGTAIMLVGGHIVHVAHPIESVEKVLKEREFYV